MTRQAQHVPQASGRIYRITHTHSIGKTLYPWRRCGGCDSHTHAHLDIAIKHAPAARSAGDALVQLICLSPRVMQAQLTVQVLQLPRTSQQKVTQACDSVWATLLNAQVMSAQAAADAHLH